MDEAREYVLFRGHVQGVGFRGTITKFCRRRNVTGWVCNTPDPTVVHAELQGSRRSIDMALRSLLSYYSDPLRSRGIDVEVIREVPLIADERGMRVISWEQRIAFPTYGRDAVDS